MKLGKWILKSTQKPGVFLIYNIGKVAEYLCLIKNLNIEYLNNIVCTGASIKILKYINFITSQFSSGYVIIFIYHHHKLL